MALILWWRCNYINLRYTVLTSVLYTVLASVLLYSLLLKGLFDKEGRCSACSTKRGVAHNYSGCINYRDFSVNNYNYAI